MTLPLTSLTTLAVLLTVAITPAQAYGGGQGSHGDPKASYAKPDKHAEPKAIHAKPDKHLARRGHQFIPPIEGVAVIRFRVPDPAKPPEHQITRATAQAQYGYWCDVTEGERLRVELEDSSGAVLHTIHDYVVPVGSEPTIVLPR